LYTGNFKTSPAAEHYFRNQSWSPAEVVLIGVGADEIFHFQCLSFRKCEFKTLLFKFSFQCLSFPKLHWKDSWLLL